MDSDRSWLRHVLLRGRHVAVGNGEGPVKGHQGAANLSIGGRINLSALGVSKEVVDHVVGALAVIATGGGGVVTEMLSTGVVHRRLVEVEAVVGGRLRGVVAISMACLVSESGGVSSHLTIMIIIAGGT